MTRRSCRSFLLSFLLLCSLALLPNAMSPGVLSAQTQTPRPAPRVAHAAPAAPGAPGARVAQVAPRFYVISSAAANLVLFVGEDSSFVAGPQYPALVSQAVATLREVKGPAVKYAFIADADDAPALMDGGWGSRGAVTLAQEQLVARLRNGPAPGTNGTVAAAQPVLGFSQVVQLHLKGEDTHIIHDKNGYAASDAVIHFEGSGIAYLGASFTNDGYPRIDVARGGTLMGMIGTVDFFATSFAQAPEMIEPIIPGRGPVATIRDLQAYRDMLRAVHDRVRALVTSGKSVQDAIAAKPTADFDARWGHGPVTPDQFVANVYASVKSE